MAGVSRSGKTFTAVITAETDNQPTIGSPDGADARTVRPYSKAAKNTPQH